jgi:hypothetical protein
VVFLPQEKEDEEEEEGENVERKAIKKTGENYK